MNSSAGICTIERGKDVEGGQVQCLKIGPNVKIMQFRRVKEKIL